MSIGCVLSQLVQYSVKHKTLFTHHVWNQSINRRESPNHCTCAPQNLVV